MPYIVHMGARVIEPETGKTIVVKAPIQVPAGLTKEECRVYMLGVSNTFQVMLEGFLDTSDYDMADWDDSEIPEDGTMGDLIESLDKDLDNL